MKSYSSPPAMAIDGARRYGASIDTSAGTMTAELFVTDAPNTVNNFVFLARDGFYDGVIFHRVIRDFMIQGGDPTGTGRGGPGYRFKDEPVSRKYDRGILAMANAGPNTNGSQFFIVYADSGLPPSYTVFGHVDDAAVKTVEDVAKQGVTGGQGDGAPKEDVTISSVTVD